jgi:hypothetical protein
MKINQYLNMVGQSILTLTIRILPDVVVLFAKMILHTTGFSLILFQLDGVFVLYKVGVLNVPVVANLRVRAVRCRESFALPPQLLFCMVISLGYLKKSPSLATAKADFLYWPGGSKEHCKFYPLREYAIFQLSQEGLHLCQGMVRVPPV